jgi:uncharacterized protein YgiM (DUF1202 family)
MKHSSRDYLIGVLILMLAVILLFGCATKSKTTEPEGTAEQSKPVLEPAPKSPEATPSLPREPSPPSQLPPRAQASPTPEASSPPSKTSEMTPSPTQRIAEIVLARVNLRKEPSMEGKIVRVLKKGTKLVVFEEEKGWLHVRLEDGAEGWVGKSTTAEGPASIASAEIAADVSGTLEINKKKLKIPYGYIDMGKPEEPVIILSDKPLPPDQIPFLQADYATKNNVHAVVIGIVRNEKKISSDMRWVYFGKDADIPFSVFPSDKVSLDLKQADDNLVVGKIKTSQPVNLTDLTYSFDASFKLDAKAALAKASAPKNVSFSGDDSAPVKAYKEYYKAIMEGNFDGMKKYLVAKNLQELEAMDSKEREMVLDFLKMRPEQLKIEKPSITGDQATFKVSGKEGSGVSTGSIKMIIENGTWKLLEDKWESVSK